MRPAHEGLQEALRVERGEEALESVVAGDAVGQFKEGAQPRLLGVAEEFHVLEALGSAEQGADGDEQDVLELVEAGALDAWIGQFAQEWRRSARSEAEDVGSGIPSLFQVRFQKYTSSNYNGAAPFRCVALAKCARDHASAR